MILNSNTLLQILVIFAFTFYQISSVSFAQQANNTSTEKLLKLTENLRISDYDELEKLIELGAEVNSINSNGVSPLYCAFECENDAYHNAVYIFSQTNASIYKDHINKLNKLLNEFDTILKNNYEYVLTLATNGSSARYTIGSENATIEINGKDFTKKEQIQELIDEMQSKATGPIKAKKLVDLLIEKGAEIDFPNENGLTILQVAIFNKDYELCKLIMPYKPNVDLVSRDGLSMLQKAIQDDDYKLSEILLTNGADPNVLDKDGVSLLQKSIENNNYSACKLLLQNGADIEMVNDKIQLVFVSKELKSVLKKFGATFQMKKAK